MKSGEEPGEYDPLRVDLESTVLSLTISPQSSMYVHSFPSLETLSLGAVGYATLLCISTLPKEVRIDLAWSWFDASNCPCKTVRSRSRAATTSHQSSS